MNDSNRGTGRTTGLMLLTLGSAALARGAEVEFIDHYPHTCDRARDMAQNVKALANHLGLVVAVRTDRSRVLVRSTFKPTKTQEAR